MQNELSETRYKYDKRHMNLKQIQQHHINNKSTMHSYLPSMWQAARKLLVHCKWRPKIQAARGEISRCNQRLIVILCQVGATPGMASHHFIQLAIIIDVGSVDCKELKSCMTTSSQFCGNVIDFLIYCRRVHFKACPTPYCA